MARICTIILTSMATIHFWPDHHHSWVILPRISLILPHILVWLVLSDFPRRISRSEELDWVILIRISLIIQQIWPGPVPSDSSQWLPSVDDHRHCSVIYLEFRLDYIGLVLSDLHRRLLHSDEHSHGWVILTCISLMAGTYTIGLSSMASIHWWQSSRLSEFTSYFAYITWNARRSCIVGLVLEAFRLWWTKSRLSDLDSYFTY